MHNYLLFSKSDISVPPTKKRRSKWDMVTTDTQTSGAAAAAAAARINAMLAAKGKLAKPDNVILVSPVFLYLLCISHVYAGLFACFLHTYC